MEENKSTLDVAIAVLPILEYLYKMGIIRICGDGQAAILLTESKFLEIWPDAKADKSGFVRAEYDGVTFLAVMGDQ